METLKEGMLSNEHDGDSGVLDVCETIRRYNLPAINAKAKSYRNMIDLNVAEIEQPLAIRNLTDVEIEDIRVQPLHLNHPCHNQSVERHVKLVTDASSQVTGFER